MPKTLTVTIGTAAKRWEIVGFKIAASETDANVGGLSVDVRETLVVDNADISSTVIQVNANNQQMRGFMADATQRITALTAGGTGPTAAYANGTREALYALLKSIGPVPTNAT